MAPESSTLSTPSISAGATGPATTTTVTANATTTATSITNQFRLPDLRTTIRLGEGAFWDVKFCPWYHSPREQEQQRQQNEGLASINPQIFALVSSKSLLIGSIDEESDYALKLLLSVNFSDDSSNKTSDGTGNGTEETQNGSLNSCTWCYIEPDRPLVAVAGDDGQVIVIDALTGSIFATLLGHGIGTVNDLATHPLYPWIITSASMDASARTWDLRRVGNPHESTCVVICGHGQAHEEGLLTVGWHARGRYLVTGGHDQKICVWTMPDLAPDSKFWQVTATENRQRSSDEVFVVHYPHFISSAVHNNYVDKTVFFGDLILSKAAEENKIVLWQITGFHSRGPPPPPETAPKTNEYLDTRNGFIRKADAATKGHMLHVVDEKYQNKPPYQRLLEFEAPHCKWFYMRFGFLQPSPANPDVHPTLAMGDRFADIMFWDFERLVIGHDGSLGRPKPEAHHSDTVRKVTKPKKGVATRIDRNELLNHIANNHTHAHVAPGPGSPGSSKRSSSVATTATSQFREASMEAASHTSEVTSTTDTNAANRNRYALDDPHKPLKAHRTLKKGFHWTARAADWSTSGRWCIIVGDADGHGVAALTKRPG